MEDYDNGVASEGSFGESVIENGFAGNNKTKNNSLTHGDFQNFSYSFITPEIIEQAGLFRVDSVTGAERVGRTATAHNDYAGIIFPYFLPEDTRPREYRLRRDKPDLEQRNGELKEKAKYVSPPGRGNMFYFPPNCRKEWLEDVSIPIVFTEGEKKELALHRASWHNLSEAAEKPRFVPIGLGGVWNWRGTVGKTNDEGKRRPIKGIIPDFQFVEWQNRKVTILFDANVSTNESVRIARASLANELHKLGAIVYLADCPEMTGCNGIDDVLGDIERKHGTNAAVQRLQDILKSAEAFKAEKLSQANQILSLAEDIEFFHTSDRTAFASVETGGHREIHAVHSRGFRDFLSYQFYQEDGKSPSSQALQDAINSLSGKAIFEGKTQDVFIRLASFNGKIYLDLCNDAWQIIEIAADGFRVIEAADAPVRFRRTKAMLPLPTPTAGGDITKLNKFFNATEKNLTLIKAWLVNCFRPDYPFPILKFDGEQGTAKTTATKVCRELVDPSLAPFRSAPRDERDLIIAATNAWICAFDNLSNVPNTLSDGFCRLSTGSGFGTRTLYANDEETIFVAKRPIILNGIGDIASNGDLIDRALLVNLEPIPKDKRKTEREFWADFEKEKTSIFSALVSAVSSALKNIENIRLPELPRMADFALWARAAETALGLDKDAFMKAYTANREDAHSIVLEGSPVADTVRKFCEKNTEFEGTIKDFLAELDALVTDETKKSKDYPKTPRALRSKLERINPNLRAIGIDIKFLAKSDKGRLLKLEYSRIQPSEPSGQSESPKTKANTTDGSDLDSQPTVSQPSGYYQQSANSQDIKFNKTNGLDTVSDGSDGSDGCLQPYSNDNGKAKFVDMEI